MQTIRVVLASGMLALLAACGGGGDTATATPPPSPSGTATVGAEGGTLSNDDGVRLTVLPGSLSEPITLRVARDTTGLSAALLESAGAPEPDKAVSLSPTYAMTPHGTRFAQPVELRIPIDEAAAASAGPGMLVALRTEPGRDGWDVLPIRGIENGQAVVSIDSFSFYKVVKITGLRLDVASMTPPPNIEMSLTLDGASPAAFVPISGNGSPFPDIGEPYRRLFGRITNATDSVRLRGRMIGLPATCSRIALSGMVDETQDPTAADTSIRSDYANPFMEVTATLGSDTTGGTVRPTLDFSFDLNLANAPYKAELYQKLRAANATGSTPPIALNFNAFAVCTTPVTLGAGIVLQNWKIVPGVTQTFWNGQTWLEDHLWRSTTLLYTADYLPHGWISHPQDATVAVGEPASFTASAWPVPVGEQRMEWWRSNDGGASWSRARTAIVPASATTDTLTLPTTTLGDNDAIFRVRLCAVPRTATPAEACTDGLPARLRVVQGMSAAAFSQQPRPVLVRTGQTATFGVAVSGTPAPSMRWQSRPANSSGAWVDVGSGVGAATLNYTTAPLAMPDNGLQLRALASNLVGEVASVPVTASVSDVDVPPTIASQPAALSVVAGSEAVFAVVARGTEALSYQWRRNGVAISGANAPVLKLAQVTAADATGYAVLVSNLAGSVVSDAAVLTVSAGAAQPVAPSIVTAPVAVVVNAGNTATFAVGVSGSGPLSYQWLRNGAPIAGATLAFHSIAQAMAGDAGMYAVRVSNGVGMPVTSPSAALTVSAGAAGSAPAISTQPATLVVAPGGSATLAVAASGSGPLAYQWLHDGAPVMGQTDAVYHFAAVSALDAGAYQVRVSNSLGEVTSAAAQLLVVGAPALIVQPDNANVEAGSTVSFGVLASGDALRYQWLRDNVAIGGATAPTYTTPATVLGDNGARFSVLVYNSAGVVFSQAAVLSVIPRTAADKLAIVANSGSGTLSIYRADASSGGLAPLGTVGTGAYPYAVVVTPNGRFAYVSDLVNNNVAVYSVDVGAGTVTLTGHAANSVNPYGIAMDPLGRFVWSVNYSASTLSAYTIDGSSGRLSAAGPPVQSPTLPIAVAAHPTGNYVYAANEGSNSVSAYSVDAGTGALTLLPGTIAHSVYRPQAIAVDPSGRFVFATEGGGSDSVTAFRVNASTGVLSVVGYASAGSSAFGLAVHPSGKFVYVTIAAGVLKFNVDGGTGELTASRTPMAAGSNPAALAIDATGTHLYVANAGSNSVSGFRIDTETGALTSLGAAKGTGSLPSGIAVTP